MEPFCPRQISFVIPGQIGVQVTATEDEASGSITFVLDVLNTAKLTGDLLGFFLQFNESRLGSLKVSGDATLTGSRISLNNVIDLGNGDNMLGAANPFDIGLKFGTEGIGKGDDLSDPVTFTLSSTSGALSLDDLAHLQVGARVTSIGEPGRQRKDSEKITALAPAAPDAKDDKATTHEDQAISIDVLTNDLSPDGWPLTIDDILQPSHGKVSIAADGKSLLYTPNKDYAGLNLTSDSIDDSFQYCVHDGHGGEDHATVTVHIIPVADQPNITVDVLDAQAGDPVNLIRLHVVASATDIDGSEFIDRLVLGNVPGNVTITSSGDLNPAGQPGSIDAFVNLTLPTDVSSRFNLDVTAYSQEKGNGDPDEAQATQSKLIELVVKDTAHTLSFATQDQSIWGTGGGQPADKEKFIGIDQHFDESLFVPAVPIPVFPGFTPVTAAAEFDLKLGLNAKLHLEAGDIDVTLPLDVAIRTLYNKTTDTLQILAPTLKVGSGASFDTTGPEGSFSLDAIAKFAFAASIEADFDVTGLTDINLTLPSVNETQNIFSFDSADASLTFPKPPLAGVTITIAWPHISTVSGTPSGDTISSDGASNNFLTVNVDMDQLAGYVSGIFAPIEASIDPDPTSETNFEYLDLDLTGGMNFLQAFDLLAKALLGNLRFENNTTASFDFVNGRTIAHASSLDADGDGLIEFALAVSPDVALTNTTKLGFNVGAHVALLRNMPIIDDSLLDKTFTLPLTDLEVFNSQFALRGFNQQDFLFDA